MAMSRHIDKEALVAAVMSSTELDNEQKSQLIRLIREQKKYGLVWEDSTEDAWEKMKTSIPVLNEVDDKRILNDKDGEHYPNHAIIEADNLHALIALTYTHEGSFDVMYFDPPYNTGNKDFVYYDDFCDDYRQIPYVDREDSYRHSKWLSFMEKRLRIAYQLLSYDGIILISINDIEIYNLKLLCDVIFGERNFVANFIWQSTPGSNTGDDIKTVTEYVLAYAKDLSKLKVNKIQLNDDETYTFEDEYVQRRGKYKLNKLDRRMTGSHYSESLNYPIKLPDTTLLYPGCEDFKQEHWNWRWSYTKIQWGIENGFIVFKKSKKGWAIYFKQYQFVNNNDELIERALPYKNLIRDIDGKDYEGMNSARGTQEVMEIFNKKSFDYPKPIKLIDHLFKCVTKKDSVILDIFAGSGTTLHATMQLNAEDGGHRQCILVTNNENNICEEVTYERNKRVIEGYTTPKGEQVAGLNHNNLRYYKLDFNPRKQSHQDNRELFYGLKDLLCIKENIYQEKQQFGSLSLEGKEQMLRYFAENGREMLMVYDTRVIPFIVNEIAQRGEQEQPLKIYIFADGAYPYADDFASVVDKVSLIPMPYAYYRGIKDSLPEETTTKVDDTELTDEEQQTMMAEAIAFESKE